MEIVLKIKGKDKTYTAGFISARMVRKTIAVSQEINFDNISPEELDKLMDYIVELFRSQFTRDELYDGLASKDLIPTITSINKVVGAVGRATAGEGKTNSGNALEPQDFIDRLYLALLEQGWTLNDIDTMDIVYYLKLLNRKRGDEMVYIDNVL